MLATCTMVVGPGVAGTAVANAGLFGIDLLDIFGHDHDKSDMHHPRPGSTVSAQTSRTTAGVAAAAAPSAKVGDSPLDIAISAGRPAQDRDGLGGLSLAPSAGRAASLPPVPTAPAARSVVIRATPTPTTPVPAPVRQTPRGRAAASLAAPPPEVPETEGQPARAVPPAPAPSAPPAKSPVAPIGPGVVRIPDSFRAGYAEYLRTATTGDLLAAALPGVAGIAGFTLIGAYAGYRQAKAIQRALHAPVPTRVML
ncbi:hypothetical protein DVS77_26460 [Mycolicibacterium moriokaense]|nr:hypothetical protein DVS77_26460 [Mycolicibacterium moriokaense]